MMSFASAKAMQVIFFFFFSSRRRHTRSLCDWSSDVCSSDLLYVGTGSTLSGDRIALSSIGDVSKVHGELSNTIFLGHTNKGHDGFVGHSILGRWVNLGAGTITSNLKNTYGPVSLWTPTGVRDTGLQFLGTLFGDHAKTGIGTRLTTATVIGAGANASASPRPPETVAPVTAGAAGSCCEH